jgi:hypothetical protein
MHNIYAYTRMYYDDDDDDDCTIPHPHTLLYLSLLCTQMAQSHHIGPSQVYRHKFGFFVGEAGWYDYDLKLPSLSNTEQ